MMKTRDSVTYRNIKINLDNTFIEVFDALPDASKYAYAFLSTDDKLYKSDGEYWTCVSRDVNVVSTSLNSNDVVLIDKYALNVNADVQLNVVMNDDSLIVMRATRDFCPYTQYGSMLNSYDVLYIPADATYVRVRCASNVKFDAALIDKNSANVTLTPRTSDMTLDARQYIDGCWLLIQFSHDNISNNTTLQDINFNIELTSYVERDAQLLANVTYVDENDIHTYNKSCDYTQSVLPDIRYENSTLILTSYKK